MRVELRYLFDAIDPTAPHTDAEAVGPLTAAVGGVSAHDVLSTLFLWHGGGIDPQVRDFFRYLHDLGIDHAVLHLKFQIAGRWFAIDATDVVGEVFGSEELRAAGDKS